MAKRRREPSKRSPNTKQFVLNCAPSVGQDDDWGLADAIDSGVVDADAAPPPARDLREPWWGVQHQGSTGACVGCATAYGVLRWHYVQAGKIPEDALPSARFIWMANKETDGITSFPTTFIETAGTQTKLALNVARNYGCVLDDVLPMDGGLTTLSRSRFYTLAARLRIASYHNLRDDRAGEILTPADLHGWKRWLAFQGPILTRLNIDRTWDRATDTDGVLEEYRADTRRGGHAVCLVGYDESHFIVRNSWGEGWGDGGFAYATPEYVCAAFTEAYGAVL